MAVATAHGLVSLFSLSIIWWLVDGSLFWWWVAVLFSFLVACYSFAGFLTDDGGEIRELQQQLMKLQQQYNHIAAERDKLRQDAANLAKSNDTLRQQANFTPTSPKYVRANANTPDEDIYDKQAAYGVLIHQRYIAHITAASEPEERLYSREKMVADGYLSPSQWNEGMKALREAGAVVKVGNSNNSQSQWVSNDTNSIVVLLNAWADSKRR